jgi:hypothetical protein
MMIRNLSWRLERLEEQVAPLEARKAWRIIFVDSDGSRTDGPIIEWLARRPPAAQAGPHGNYKR